MCRSTGFVKPLALGQQRNCRNTYDSTKLLQRCDEQEKKVAPKHPAYEGEASLWGYHTPSPGFHNFQHLDLTALLAFVHKTQEHTEDVYAGSYPQKEVTSFSEWQPTHAGLCKYNIRV